MIKFILPQSRKGAKKIKKAFGVNPSDFITMKKPFKVSFASSRLERAARGGVR